MHLWSQLKSLFFHIVSIISLSMTFSFLNNFFSYYIFSNNYWNKFSYYLSAGSEMSPSWLFVVWSRMKIGEFFKNLVTLYVTIWLLVIKKLKIGYKLDGNKVNFGVFLQLVDYFRKKEETTDMTRSVSFPMMQRSDSVRDLNGRRRFLSAPESRKNRKTEEFSQDFTLRKKSDPSSTPRTGKMKFTCKQSLLLEKQAKKWK